MILIVDTDPDFLEKARQVLNRERQVFLASTCQSALTLAEDLGFSVVLVDLNLADGLALILEIKKRFPGLPVIALSESHRKSVLELARDSGAVEILHKPITSEWKPVVERVRAMRVRPTRSAEAGV